MSTTLLERNGLTTADIDILIPHQANRRIIDATIERLGLHAGKSDGQRIRALRQHHWRGHHSAGNV